ncbi:MAG: hypothetical protein IJH07_08325 [Ruminococcus sp.]|nr:hypothetical protein [Ruminococcus sp.]
MNKQILKKEEYERSSLIVTEFAKEDVIVTSGEDTLFSFLFGDNDRMMPNR